MATSSTESAASPLVRMRAVDKWFGQHHVLKQIDFDIDAGQRAVICGPSGSGKSTLIRCLCELEVHQKGDIEVNGRRLVQDQINRQHQGGEVGMVFQQFNLFPHLTVLENLTLAPMRVRGLARSEAEELARHPASIGGDRADVRDQLRPRHPHGRHERRERAHVAH